MVSCKLGNYLGKDKWNRGSSHVTLCQFRVYPYFFILAQSNTFIRPIGVTLICIRHQYAHVNEESGSKL